MAIREMSERQFITAAKRNGFDLLPLGTHLVDYDLGFSSGLIFVVGKRGGIRRICFRESLARAIQERTKVRRQRKKHAARKTKGE